MSWDEWDFLREIRDRLKTKKLVSQEDLTKALLICIEDTIDRNRE